MADDYRIVDKVLVIEAGRKEIASHEFFEGDFVKAIIPEGVKKIGYWGFGGCKKLKEIVLPSSLESVAGEAFAMCPLKEIHFTNGCPRLRNVSSSSFGDNTTPWIKQQKKEQEYVIVGAILFRHRSGEQKVVIPEGFEVIGENAFCDDAAEEIVIPEGVKIIKHCAFSNCKKLKSVQLPNSVESIEDAAFLGCKELKEVVLPKKLKTLGSNVFGMCTSLESIVFPDKLKSVGANLFTNGYSANKTSIHNVESLIPAMLNGCKLNTKTSMWFLENLWNNGQSLKGIAVIYLTQSGTKVPAQAELILLRNKEQAISIMKELKNNFTLKPTVIEKLDSFLKN